MSVDSVKVGNLVRLIDVLVDTDGCGYDLDEKKIDELIARALSILSVTFSEDELKTAKIDISTKYRIYTSPGRSIIEDYEQENWYDDRKADIKPRFWNRYRDYLIDQKKFSPNVVSTLGLETLDTSLMNYIVDPKSDTSSLRRGLVIGDVQSGKTSTYIGFICKAADAGYKVFILLTGTIETLRKQTQERVEEGLIGIDMTQKGNNRVGVGIDNKPIMAMSMTSRVSDFVANADKIAVSLNNHEAVVFVIKKNPIVLTKLKEWLISLNSDPITRKINMPMLLIDDEADNASINTRGGGEEYTCINGLIRELIDLFTKSNYVGFTATPFANVFIDPIKTEDMINHDLFPENFIVALPTPNNYIGASSIFSETGKYHSHLEYIIDAGIEKEDGYPFYFKHKKEWSDELPDSLTDSIYTFYLANAIRDLRGDITEHRSMLINMSRFITVQKHIKSNVEDIHKEAYRAIKYDLNKQNFDESMKNPILARIYGNWIKHYKTAGFSWESITACLFNAIENIQIKVVNSAKSSEKLDYPENISIRAIVIGGLALSRGLTLEGLVVSYFYRNTCTYDVLMQMGRWFGYRRNYDDLFRIWTHKDSADWYAEISDATDILKSDMDIMRERKMVPKNFGIRVRNDSEYLNITARNKMRHTSDAYEFTGYFGEIYETPYINTDPNVNLLNYRTVEIFVEQCVAAGYNFALMKTKGAGEHHIIYDVPKLVVLTLLRKLSISKYNIYFDVKQITDYLEEYQNTLIDKIDVAFMDGSDHSPEATIDFHGRKIYKVKRKNCIFDKSIGKLSLGRRGKLGGPNDGLVGLNEPEIIDKAKADFKDNYYRIKGEEFTAEKVYPSNTWFKFVEKRKPLLIIYLLDIYSEENQKIQEEEFRIKMAGIPAVGFAFGLPQNKSEEAKKIKYKENTAYKYYDQDEIFAEAIEEE